MDMPIPLFSADVRARALLVLAYLWTHVRIDRETKMPQSLFVWPSRAKMARELKVAETAVSREVRLLELAGLLAREKRDIQGKMLSGYALTLSPVLPIGHVPVTPVSCNTGVTIELPMGHKGVTPVSSKGDPGVTRTRKKQKEQERTKNSANDTAPISVKDIARGEFDGWSITDRAESTELHKCLWSEFVAKWAGSKPRNAKATADDLRRVKAAVKAFLPSDVLIAVRSVAVDAYWAGRKAPQVYAKYGGKKPTARKAWGHVMRTEHLEGYATPAVEAATQSQGVESWS